MKQTLLFLFSLIASQTHGQTYSGPESVEFDYANNRWLISNTSSHQILSRSSAGVLSVFASGFASGPYGIEIVGDTLFCCSGGFIKGYDLNSAAQVFNLNLGGTFLNGITHDAIGNLWTTDFSAKKIFKVNIAALSFLEVATGLTQSPNGIIYDGANSRCIFVNWGANAPIKAIDINTNAISTIATTTLSNCDGIAVDGQGNYYISNWGNQSVKKYNNTFTGTSIDVATGLNNPADIFYNIVGDTLGIPNAGNNTVTFVGFNTTSNVEIASETIFSVLSNPVVNGATVYFNLPSPTLVRIELVDVSGKVVNEVYNSGSDFIQSHSFLFDAKQLLPGIYFLKLKAGKKMISTKIVVSH